ncbi:MarR family winged helix-turn-helix transcriptional regulator [Xanthomonas sp. GW]|uniref:MarR family winged helix-turn-helix transcriptional regulator n=1 Tax=Xanthomonas sp. GW TaxID=2724121 RepID=UPI001C8E938E|nr:MarR family transcriptional regulator [Xanthomonas sp. GW]
MTELILAIFRANGALAAWGDGFASEDGLSTARWQMLGAVALSDRPLTAPQIATRMGVTRQGAQKQLNILVQEGMLEAHPNPLHKRSPHYVLSEQGRSVYEAIDRRWNAHVLDASAAFFDADLQAVGTFLNKLTAMYAAKGDGNDAEA